MCKKEGNTTAIFLLNHELSKVLCSLRPPLQSSNTLEHGRSLFSSSDTSRSKTGRVAVWIVASGRSWWSFPFALPEYDAALHEHEASTQLKHNTRLVLHRLRHGGAWADAQALGMWIRSFPARRFQWSSRPTCKLSSWFLVVSVRTTTLACSRCGCLASC